MKPVNIREFTGGIGKGDPPPVVFLCPAAKPPFGREDYEPFLVDEALRKLTAAYVPAGMEDMAYSVFYADESPIPAIVEEARTYPFLAERRVVVVRNAERYKDLSGEKRSPLAPLLEYIENPAETTLLVLAASAVDRRKKFYKACEKNACLVESPQLTEGEMREWINAEMRARGRRLEEAALRELMERAGNRLSDVNNALLLVCGYAGSANTVTEADVRAACADVAEETVWQLTDAIAGSMPDVALASLYQLQALNKAPEEIIGTINWLLENAYRAHPETEPVVGKPFVERKVAPLARTLGLQKLKAAMALCTKTMFQMRSTGVDRDLALEMLVIKLASHPGVRRAGAH